MTVTAFTSHAGELRTVISTVRPSLKPASAKQLLGFGRVWHNPPGSWRIPDGSGRRESSRPGVALPRNTTSMTCLRVDRQLEGLPHPLVVERLLSPYFKRATPVCDVPIS